MKRSEHPSDEHIVRLYWERCESAVAETAAKYGSYLTKIAHSILSSREDAEESVNDTYLDAWNSMPPNKPVMLSTFLGKITRRISIDKWRKMHADKRGGGEIPLVLDELGDCIFANEDTEAVIDRRENERIIGEFLDSLTVTERRVFLLRYWFMQPTANIAARFGFSQSKTASMLHRMRLKLREKLKSEELI